VLSDVCLDLRRLNRSELIYNCWNAGEPLSFRSRFILVEVIAFDLLPEAHLKLYNCI
jgi:hypothetical protein